MSQTPTLYLLSHPLNQNDPVFAYYNKKRSAAEKKQERDPEKGAVIDVVARWKPYTYAGQVKSMMKEVHHARVPAFGDYVRDGLKESTRS